MTDNVIQFRSRPRFDLPCVVVEHPGWLPSGEPLFFVTYHFSEADGGGDLIVSDRTSHAEALADAMEFKSNEAGLKVYDLVAGVCP